MSLLSIQGKQFLDGSAHNNNNINNNNPSSILSEEPSIHGSDILSDYENSIGRGKTSSLLSKPSLLSSSSAILDDASTESSLFVGSSNRLSHSRKKLKNEKKYNYNNKNKNRSFSSRPTTSSGREVSQSSFSNRLLKMLERPSTAPTGSFSSRKYEHFTNSEIIEKANPKNHLQQFSTISRSSIANVIPSWKLARGKRKTANIKGKEFRGGYYQKRNANSLFWVPSQPIDVYCVEKSAFRSHDRWAFMKLLESVEQSNGLTPSSVTSRHAIDILLRVTRRKMEEYFGYEPTRTTIMAFCIAIFDFQNNKKAFVEGSYIRCNCYFQDVHVLRAIEEEELARVPEIEEYNKKEQKHLEGCRNALTFSSRSWQLTIKGVIFKRWRDGFKAAKVSEARFKEFLKKMCQPNLKPIIVGWQNYVRTDVSVQLNKELRNLVRKIKYAKQQLSIVEGKCKRATTNINMYKVQIENLILAEVTEKTKLEEPGRSPKQMKWAASSLAACILKFSSFLTDKIYHAKSEVDKVDPMNICLDTIEPPEGSKFAETFTEKFDQAEALEMSDDDVDVVFPYDLLSGMRLAHWTNHVVQTYCDEMNISLIENDEKLNGLLYESGEDLNSGKTFELLAKALVPHQYKDAIEFTQRKKSNALFQAVVKSTSSASQQKKEMLSNVLRAFQKLKPHGVGNFMTIDDLYVNNDDDDDGKSNSSNGGAHARMVTMYMGEQIDLEDNTEQLQFNFLLNILDSCLGVKPPQRKLDSIANFIKSYEADFGPFKDMLKNGILLRERLDIDAEALVHGQGLTEASSGILTVSHTKEHAHDDEKKKQHEEERKRLENNINDEDPENIDNDENSSNTIESIDYKTLDVHDLSQHLITRSLSVNESLKEIITLYHSTIEQRKQWMEWKLAVRKLGWRSMCHTLLSQKVAVEEHVDDGKFTNVTLAQVQDVLEKAGETDKNIQNRTVEEIIELLKEHLPMLEQIFVHYCTHGSGGSNESMDRGEYWRFIRDIKVKHKKKLTSVDIDLIFTAANVDRDDDDDDDREEHSQELLPIEFSECLVRLAVARFDQGPVIMRLQRLFDAHVLKNACSTNKNIFKRQIETDKVKKVYSKFKKPLGIIYKAYASADQQNDAVNKKDSINLNEFLLMCKQLGVLKSGSNLSEVAATKIFALVQGNDALDDTSIGKPPKIPKKQEKIDPDVAAQFNGTAEEANAATVIQGRFRIRQAQKVVEDKKVKKKEEEEKKCKAKKYKGL